MHLSKTVSWLVCVQAYLFRRNRFKAVLKIGGFTTHGFVNGLTGVVLKVAQKSGRETAHADPDVVQKVDGWGPQ